MVCSLLSPHASTDNEQLATKKARVAGSVFPFSIVLHEVSITTYKIISSPKIFSEVHFLIFSKNWSVLFETFSQKFFLTVAAWFCSLLSHHASTDNEQLATKKARVAGSVFPCSIVLHEVSITACKIIFSPKHFQRLIF